MSYDDWKARTPDTDPAPEDRHGHGECECHCSKCGVALELDPIYGTVYATCGDCYGGGDVDGEAFRGGEAAAYAREQMAAAQRVK